MGYQFGGRDGTTPAGRCANNAHSSSTDDSSNHRARSGNGVKRNLSLTIRVDNSRISMREAVKSDRLLACFKSGRH